MSIRFEAVTFRVADPHPVAAFWAALLSRDAVVEPDSVLVPGTATQAGLRFVTDSEAAVTQSWLHLHLTSSSIDDQRQVVDEVIGAGGTRRGERPLPWGDDIYLADPAGNGFCLIEPGSAFLEGTGALGEVTCDGGREVGAFWSAALRQPIVWDRDEQTAIQSPLGGTKLSWDGADSPGVPASPRQRFDLRASDPDGDIAELLALGATRATATSFRDPGGFPFTVAPE